MKKNDPQIPYALDREGHMAYVDDVPNGKNCRCICPSCRQPLEACNGGTKRQHYFRHQSGIQCEHAYEGMLHKLAEERIKKAFDESDVMNVRYQYRSYCKYKATCKLYSYCGKCYDESQSEKCFNLKDWYDCCELEESYTDMNRRSDLKLTSSTHPSRKPVYIEIWVTHKSDQQKLSSGAKIIEVKIDKVEDIDEIVINGFVENFKEKSNDQIFYRTVKVNIEQKYAWNEFEKYSMNMDDAEENCRVRFYGFKKIDCLQECRNVPVEFVRAVLYTSNKVYVEFEDGKCGQLKKKFLKSRYEVCFHGPEEMLSLYSLRETFLNMCYEKFDFRSCEICKNYVLSYNGTGMICKMYKVLGISHWSKVEKEQRLNCEEFAYAKPMRETFPYTEFVQEEDYDSQ